jgi:hypothetical protein
VPILARAPIAKTRAMRTPSHAPRLIGDPDTRVTLSRSQTVSIRKLPRFEDEDKRPKTEGQAQGTENGTIVRHLSYVVRSPLLVVKDQTAPALAVPQGFLATTIQ